MQQADISEIRWRYTLGTIFNIVADQVPVLALLVTFFFYTKVMHQPLVPATAFIALNLYVSANNVASTDISQLQLCQRCVTYVV
jgi:hypothetical protein